MKSLSATSARVFPPFLAENTCRWMLLSCERVSNGQNVQKHITPLQLNQISCFPPKKKNTFQSFDIGLNSRTRHHQNNNVESACIYSCFFGFRYCKSWLFTFFWCWLLQVVLVHVGLWFFRSPSDGDLMIPPWTFVDGLWKH